MTWSFDIGISIPGVLEHWAACLNISSSKLKRKGHHFLNARLDIVHDRACFSVEDLRSSPGPLLTFEGTLLV
jgi:lipoate-protein ligase A